jgi:Heme/copper-type cytochrome/quinol oxidases, subunit 2
LHLPVGKPVKVLLRSIDVLHDFYVPEFRAKMDMIPGSVTYYWFTPTRTGTFEVLWRNSAVPRMRRCGARSS